MDPSEEDEGFQDYNEDGFTYRCPPVLPVPYSFPLLKEQPPAADPILSSPPSSPIPWEEIAAAPPSPSRPLLTWDNLQIPIPYRYQARHVLLAADPRPIPLPPTLSNEECTQWINIFWRQNEKFHFKDKPEYIRSEDFIQNVFHLLAARTSSTFFLDDEGFFRKKEHVLLDGVTPCALSNYCAPFLRCGNVVRELKSAGERKGNSVEQSCAKFIGNWIQCYETVLMLNAPRVKGLVELMRFIKPLEAQLELLRNVWAGNHQAADLLSTLNDLLFTECSPWTVDLVRNLFLTCASAYLKQVSNWVFRGELGPKSEFHIARLSPYSYRDRRCWTKQFVEMNSIPKFLEESGAIIFECGKVINLLCELQKERVLSPIGLFPVHPTASLLPLSLSFQQVEQLQLTCASKLSTFKEEQSHLLEEIRDSIASLRNNNNNIWDVDASGFVEGGAAGTRAARSEAHEKKRALHQQRRDELDRQVAQNVAKARREEEEARLEDFKRQEYNEMVGRRVAQEGRRMEQKYFGDSFVAPPGQKGTFHRIHSVLPATAAPLESMPEKVNGFEYPQPYSPLPPPPTEEPLEELEVFCDAEETPSPEEFVDASENLDVVEVEQRFNPDKIPTVAPPPYSISHILPQSSANANLSFFDLLKSSSSFNRSDTSNSINTSSKDVHCLSSFISSSVSIPLTLHREIGNTALLHYFVVEKKLFHHVAALNNYLCLQNGLFAQKLNDLLLQEVHRNNSSFSTGSAAYKGGRLNSLLSEAIASTATATTTTASLEEEEEFTQHLSFTTNESEEEVEEVAAKSSSIDVYSSLNSVRLVYTVDWPLNIVFTEELLHYYERLSTLLLKLIRTEHLLARCFLQLKMSKGVVVGRGSKELFILQGYRARMLHFVCSVRHYVNVTVVACSWDKLVNSFEGMDSLDKIYEALVHHIKHINSSCLLGPKAEKVMQLLTNQLVLIESFCNQLSSTANPRVDTLSSGWRGEVDFSISSQDFKKLEQKFKAVEELGKYFIEVAYKLVNKGVYPQVSHFLELYNFNGFFKMRQKHPAVEPQTKTGTINHAMGDSSPPHTKGNVNLINYLHSY